MGKISCRFLGCHEYEVIKEIDLKDNREFVIGTIIVSRCKQCGKIVHHKIYTQDER